MQTESGSVRSQEHTISTLPAEAAGNTSGTRRAYFAAGSVYPAGCVYVDCRRQFRNPAHWIGAGLFLLLAAWLVLGFRQRLHWCVPSVCLLLMACYGVGQTIWSPYKILSEGWRITIFWWACAGICLLAHQLFRDLALARHFRLAFVYFASLICLLDLLQQASHTTKVVVDLSQRLALRLWNIPVRQQLLPVCRTVVAGDAMARAWASGERTISCCCWLPCRSAP